MQSPYGSWKSPISTDLIVAESIALGGARFSGDYQYWTEGRPQEGGRLVVVRRDPDGNTIDMNPPPFNARTRVHEYGGGAWLIHNDELFFSNFADQQVYRVRAGETPTQLTSNADVRFANGFMDATRNRIIYVMESHAGEGEAENFLGAVDLSTGEITRLADGHDFFAAPTVSADHGQLAWISWDHPNMPWDGTDLWLADIDTDGLPTNVQHIAGGPGESVQQPVFNTDGTLYFISDRTGWWNLHRRQGDDVEIVCEKAAEFGGPQWGLGMSTYMFCSPGEILCIYGEKNEDTLARLKVDSGQLDSIDLPFTSFGGLDLCGDTLTFVAASPTAFGTLYNFGMDNGELITIRQSCPVELDPGYYSVPEAIEFPTAGDDIAHAFYYPPANRDFNAPAGDLPPVIFVLHGGPTGASHATLSLSTQFWTSRGFAVIDVNYRGSTGYGRAYRQKLNGAWGIADVEDTVHAAEYLVSRKLADPERLAIRGGSAGGYTTLAALTFTDTFSAGASYYGIGDLEALVKDTHKFESRYCDSVIGEYPAERDVYLARSPLNHVDQLACPAIFFQGLEDKVVPPNQAEAMVEALTTKGIPVAYVPFEGEQHGFRRAENIKRALDLELYFYSRVFGFSIADQIEPIRIANLPP